VSSNCQTRLDKIDSSRWEKNKSGVMNGPEAQPEGAPSPNPK